MESSFLEFTSAADLETDRGFSSKQKSKSVSAQTTISDSKDGCFECYICLESAHDPVLTLCGHLYCWPCIYKWLHVSTSPMGYQPQRCPVCKANISSTSLVPLYGRGASISASEDKTSQHQVAPARPPSTAASIHHSSRILHQNYFQPQPHSYHRQHYFPHVYGGTPSFLGGTAVTSLLLNPTIGMFGEAGDLARMFRSSQANLFHPYSNIYHPIGRRNARIRRQELETDKSLSRVSFFLFCCLVLCLLLF